MILKEQEVEKNEIMWKVGDEPSFGFLIKKGSFEFIDCKEAVSDE